MFGTVADTATKRIAEPRILIRDTTTSRVLPRNSFSIWTCALSFHGERNLYEIAHFVDEEEFYVR
jgi:hypothetical protein